MEAGSVDTGAGLAQDIYSRGEEPEEQQVRVVTKDGQDPEEQSGGNLSIEKTELDLIRRALTKYHGNRKLAAEELGISERTLYRKLKSMDQDAGAM